MVVVDSQACIAQMRSVKGVAWGVANARIKNNDRNDVVVLKIDEGSEVAGVFTRNAFCAEPVKLARAHLQTAPARYFLINSGNANACTGAAGMRAAKATCDALAALTAVAPESVLPFSTGVIGQLLPAQRIIDVLPQVLNDCHGDAHHWHAAAEAIMTTDTRPKTASRTLSLQGEDVVISGIGKGAGMIKPNMGTMLAYVATDASISAELLAMLAKQAANQSFNRITIDGDTSTNDAAMLVATGQSGAPRIESQDSEDFALFSAALIEVYQSLAQQIVRDGEGATKFVSVQVNGGATAQESLDVAYAIAHSPLVKTALFASDPNWGRIVAAIGNAGLEQLDVEKITVYLDDVLIVKHGGCADSYTEEAGSAIFAKPEFTITVNLQRGDCDERLWTTDLSYEYIKINAEYRS